MNEQASHIKVSVIIPVYNVESYIVRCIESVLRQTYRNLEVLLVDDCSPDRSMELAKDLIELSLLSKDLSIVYLKHDHNRGLSAARNTGMDAATGDYVFFLDSDDEITEDCIEKLVSPLGSFYYDFLIGDYAVIGSDSYFPPLNLKEGALMSNEQIVREFSNGNWYVMAFNKLTKTHFLKEHKLLFKEGLIHEDELWSFMIACMAQSMYVVKKKIYNYYIHDNSIMSNQTKKGRYNTMIEILHLMYSFQAERKLTNLSVEGIILKFIKRIYCYYLVESVFCFYMKIREADNRDSAFKRKIYGNLSLKIKFFDFFINKRLGFFYRYLFWNLMKIKTMSKNLPFIFWCFCFLVVNFFSVLI